jgi:hypothetical protein
VLEAATKSEVRPNFANNHYNLPEFDLAEQRQGKLQEIVKFEGLFARQY